MTYFADVATLARKDLRLELRARDTLPAMLLFVLSTLVVFHFALPDRRRRGRGAGTALGRARLHRAARAGARLGARARGRCARGARARALRPERDLAREVGRGLRLPGRDRARRAARLRALLLAARARRVLGVLLANVGICAVGTLLAAMAAASRTRELILPLLFLPLAIPLVVGGVGASVSTEPGATWRSSVCTTPSSRYCAGRPLSTSSPNSSAPKIPVPALAAVAAGLVGLSIVLAFFVAPEDADQGISQRIFYFHVPIALTAYACFGWGAYKALLLLWKRRGALRPRELRRDPPGHDLRRAHARHRLDLGEGVVGPLVGLGLEPARALPRPLPLLLAPTSCCASRSRKGRGARTSRRLRALRGRPDPGQLPRDPACR